MIRFLLAVMLAASTAVIIHRLALEAWRHPGEAIIVGVTCLGIFALLAWSEYRDMKDNGT